MVLGDYPTMAPGGMSMQQAVTNIKAKNPNALVFTYVNANQLRPDQALGTTSWGPYRTEINNMKWWLYSDKGLSQFVNSGFGPPRQRDQHDAVHAEGFEREYRDRLDDTLFRHDLLDPGSGDRRLFHGQRVLASLHRRRLEPRRHGRFANESDGAELAPPRLRSLLLAGEDAHAGQVPVGQHRGLG